MDQALKQRLVGAFVITALAAIFVPMFFEDSVDESRREVDQSSLAIPAAPEKMFSEDNPIPKAPQQLHATEEETTATTPEAETNAENAAAPDEEGADVAASDEETAQPEQPLAQTEEEAATEEEAQQPVAAPAPGAIEKQAAVAEHEAAPLPLPTPPRSVHKVQPPQTAALQPVQEQPAVAQPKPAPVAIAPAAKTHELKRWVLQLGSFSKKANADSLVNKLRSQGFNAYDDTIQVEGKGTMYRVRIGPELDKKRAQATQKKLQQLNAANSMLISE